MNVPGNKGYDRLLWALENNLSAPKRFYISSMEFLASMAVPEGSRQEDINISNVTLRDRKLPQFCRPDTTALSEELARVAVSDWAIELQEWAGMISLQSARTNANDTIDEHLCNSFSGCLIPAKWTKQLWQSVIESEAVSWGALTTFGLEDATTAWKQREHTYHLGGENNINLVKLESGFKLTCQIVSGRDLQG
jgi:hypothetical protein